MGTGTTTFVHGAWFEVATTETGAVTAWRHYLDSPEGVIGVVTRYPAQAATTRYWHKDHLGSMVAETDAGGANVERFAYDAWGKRRLATQLPGDPPNLASASSQRGFTGHEHLDEVGIVHMNGRLYNPVTGHFLQADPIIQEPLDAQSYNRYGYVLNNPLSYTDPSGFSFWKTWGRPLLAIVAAFFMQVYLMPALLGTGLSCTSGLAMTDAISTIASGFAAGGISGGNLQSALQGALGASLFFAAGSIAQVAATTGEAAASAFAEGMPGRVALHATAGCASNAAAGGSCKHGAASAGFAQIAGPYIHTDSVAYNVAASAVAGGVGAVLGGGKFQNGAVTGAFGYLFNAALHDRLAATTRVEIQGNRAAELCVSDVCFGAGRLTPGPDSIHLSVTIYDAYDGITTLEAQPRIWRIHGPCPVSTLVCLNAEAAPVTKPRIVWGPLLLSGPSGADSYAHSWRSWASDYQNWQVPYRYPAPNSNWWIYQGIRATGTLDRTFNFAPFQAPGYGN